MEECSRRYSSYCQLSGRIRDIWVLFIASVRSIGLPLLHAVDPRFLNMTSPFVGVNEGSSSRAQ
jgi:hypothetical protein